MNKDDIKLWHVANAGVILGLGNFNIGIDILCDQIKPYRLTPQEVENQVLDPEICPKLDYLIITHEHGDHFSRQKLINFLKGQPQVKVISNKTVAEELGEYLDCSNLVIAGKNRTESTIVRDGDIELRVFHSTHMGALYKEVINLCTIINWKGKKLLIPGDAEPRELLAGENLKDQKIDLMIVPFPYITLNSVRKAAKEKLRPDHIFVLHLPSEKHDRDGLIQQSQDIYFKEREAFPNTVFGKQFGVTYHFA